MMTRNETHWLVRHTIPSDTSIASRLIDQLLEVMLERGWPAQELFHVQLAYEEAVVNAIVHGNKRSASKTVDVMMSCASDRVEIQITDQGAGFDPQEVPDPRQEQFLEVPGGRGLLLMHEVMSEIGYNAEGNQITMIKTR